MKEIDVVNLTINNDKNDKSDFKQVETNDKPKEPSKRYIITSIIIITFLVIIFPFFFEWLGIIAALCLPAIIVLFILWLLFKK